MSVSLRTLRGIPEVRPGDDLARMIAEAAGEAAIASDQVLAIAHTVVSKAEGAIVSLADVKPGERARRLAAEQRKDPRVVQVVLDECAEVLRAEHGVIIGRTRHGLVCANGGVDASNTAGADTVVLLPRDPDASARSLRARLRELGVGATGAGATGAGARSGAASGAGGSADALRAPAIMITDTFGRAWRHGQTDVAIGLAGLAPLDDWRGRRDASGLPLRATWLAIADAAAAAADLARAKDSREPVVVIEGLERFITEQDGPGAAAIIRPVAEDLFG
ncbi:MAG TPA: coenzyme F420-0:L-glutamate ligase [Solirubrobacteraceae bacterium]|nr:coenzyme F420-0:L-glutamate ligase [Solirubrobacteraceae bacterium]